MPIHIKLVTSIIILSLAASIFIGTSFIVRQGNEVTNWQSAGTGRYRDVRGFPFVYLKRSIGDGQCDVRDLKAAMCDSGNGNEPHALKPVYIVIDLAVWVAFSYGLVYSTKKLLRSKVLTS